MKTKELIALRGHYFSAVLLISSGLAGLFFANIVMGKIIFLASVGIFFDYIFIGKFLSVNSEIKSVVYGRSK